MHFVEKDLTQKRIDLDTKLKSNKILRVPGAYNPLTAKLIEEIGYDAVYVSGGVMANDLGFPDIGLTTLQDVSTRSYLISRVTNLPTIVDIDTGFKSCKETIETFEDFGVAAVHLEDQIEQKRCGHLDNKELISKDKMVSKIKECVSARKDKNFKIIARSDAKSVEGIDSMIDRCKAYKFLPHFVCLKPTINKTETRIQIKITGGIGKPKNFPFNEARFFNQSGTTPKTVPPVTVGSETNI